jgi:hypothetical protein
VAVSRANPITGWTFYHQKNSNVPATRVVELLARQPNVLPNFEAAFRTFLRQKNNPASAISNVVRFDIDAKDVKLSTEKSAVLYGAQIYGIFNTTYAFPNVCCPIDKPATDVKECLIMAELVPPQTQNGGKNTVQAICKVHAWKGAVIQFSNIVDCDLHIAIDAQRSVVIPKLSEDRLDKVHRFYASPTFADMWVSIRDA